MVALSTSRKLLLLTLPITPETMNFMTVPPPTRQPPPQLPFFGNVNMPPFDIQLKRLYLRDNDELMMMDELQHELEQTLRMQELQQKVLLLREPSQVLQYSNHTSSVHTNGWNAIDRNDGGLDIVSPISPSLESVKRVLLILQEYVDSNDGALLVVHVDVTGTTTMDQVRNVYKNILVVKGALEEMKDSVQPAVGTTTHRPRRKWRATTIGYNESIHSAISHLDACTTIPCLENSVRPDILRLVHSETKNLLQFRFDLWNVPLNDFVIAWIQLLHGIVDESFRGHVAVVHHAQEEEEDELVGTTERAWSILFQDLLHNDTTLQSYFQRACARKQQQTLHYTKKLDSRWTRLFDKMWKDDEIRAFLDQRLQQDSLVVATSAASGKTTADKDYLALLKRLKQDSELRQLFDRSRSKQGRQPNNTVSVVLNHGKSRSKNQRVVVDVVDADNDETNKDMLAFGIELAYLYPTKDEWLESLQSRLENVVQLQQIHAALEHAGVSNAVFHSMASLKTTHATRDVWKLAPEHVGFELVSPLNPSLQSVETVVTVMKDLGVQNDPLETVLHVSVDARNKTVAQIRNAYKNFLVVEQALDEIRHPLHRAGRTWKSASIARVFASVQQAHALLDACDSVACLKETAEPTESTWYPIYLMCLRVKDDNEIPNFATTGQLDNNLRIEFRGIQSTVESHVVIGWIRLLNRIVQESFRGVTVLDAQERTVDEAWLALVDTLLNKDDTLRPFLEEQRQVIYKDSQNVRNRMNARWIRLFDVMLANDTVRDYFDGVVSSERNRDDGAVAVGSAGMDEKYSKLLVRLERDTEVRKCFDISRSKFPFPP